jgi:hypothetical protein
MRNFLSLSVSAKYRSKFQLVSFSSETFQGDRMGKNPLIVILSHVYVSKGLLEVRNRAIGPFDSSADAVRFLEDNRFKRDDNERDVRWRGRYGDLDHWEWDAFIEPVLDI